MPRKPALTAEQVAYVKELAERGVSKSSIGRVVQHEQKGKKVNTSTRIVREVLAGTYTPKN